MRWLLGLLVVAALGAGAWLVLHDSAGTKSSDEEAAGHGVDARNEGPALHGTGAAAARELAGAKGRASIDVDVRLAGRGVVAAVEIRRVGGMDTVDPFRRSGGWYRAVFALPEPDRAPLATTKSDAQGRARLTGLAPGIYRIAARDGAGNEAGANAALPQEGAHGAVTLDLEPATLVLEARLTWSDGKPLTGTLVLTKTADPRSQSLWVPPQGDAPRAVIQPDGKARVERLRAGTYDVRVHVSEGLALSGPQAVLPAKAPYVFVVDAGQQRVEGRAVDAVAGSPVSGATVLGMCGLDGSRTQLFAHAVTDGDGRFAFAVPRMPAQLVVEAAGYAPAQRQVAAAGTDVTVRLSKVTRVSGRVTGPDGVPAAGAVVRASSSERSGRMTSTATADKEGRYALEDVSTGDVQIVVKGGGWVSPGLGDVTSGGFNPFIERLPAGASVTRDLTAVRAGRIEGKVLDAAGATVAGAIVTPQPAQRGGNWDGFGDYMIPMTAEQETVATDDSGAFTLDSLTPGTAYTLNADAPEQARATAGPFSVDSGATVQAELRFPVPRFVDVLLLHEGEETPVVGARVMALAQSGSGSWPSRGTQSGSALTDAEGRARTGPVGEGALSVFVTGTMVAMKSQATPVEGSTTGAGPFAVTIRMPRGLTIEGRVLKPDGSPAMGADVQLDGDRMGNYQDVRTDAEGAFTLPGLAAGSRTLRASLRSPDRTRVSGLATAEAGSTGVTITLGMDAERGKRETFRFRVLDDQGVPVPSGSVRLTYGQGGGSLGTNFTDGVGTLETDVTAETGVARALAKGEVFAEASDARGSDGFRLPLGPGRVGPIGVDQREIEVRLPAERAISGRVTTTDGARLAGVLVRAMQAGTESSRGGGSGASDGRSDAQGAFRIGGLGEGEYQLSVAASPDYVPLPPQTAASGATGVELKLRQGVRARVRVLDYAGKPVSGSSVNLRATPKPPPGSQPGAATAPGPRYDPGYGRGGSGNLDTTTAMDGTASFRGLDSETTYALSAGAPATRDDVRSFRQEGWAPADTDVRMERGYVVAGSVRDAQGKPVEGANLMRKGEKGGWSGERLNADGAFRIRGLEAGLVTLKAVGPGQNRRMNEGGNEVSVQAGTEDVVLVVEPGLSLTVRVSNASERREGRLRVTLMQWENDRWSQNESERDRDRTGVVVFRGLKAGERYGVWIAPDGDERYAWQTEVRPGEVTVRLERGGTIRGRLTFPAEMQANVSAQNALGLQVPGSVDAEGRYEVKGLPEGRWTVSANAAAQAPSSPGTPRPAGASTYVMAHGEVQTGGTLDLTLQPPGR